MSLRFKGDPPKKKKRKAEGGAGGGDDDEDEALAAAAAEYSSDPVSGAGTLMSSGVVVMGTDTDFTKELEVGDTLLVTVTDRFRNTVSDEARVVNMVLSKGSLNVNAPFSCDITSASSFMFVKKKPDLEALKAARREKKKLAKQSEEESKTVSYKVVVAGSGPGRRTMLTTTATARP